MATLLLGLATQPILIAVGQVHEIEHAAFGLEGHDHGSEADHRDGVPSDHDPGHATGTHSLMHHQTVVVVAIVPSVGALCGVVATSPTTFNPLRRNLPTGGCGLPFRPPIA
ncbi:MAG TPA: hypothetical protein VIT90_05090 [Lysobacter sp.]